MVRWRTLRGGNPDSPTRRVQYCGSTAPSSVATPLRPGFDQYYRRDGPAPAKVLAGNGIGSADPSGALGGQRTAGHVLQWNAQGRPPHWGQAVLLARGVPMAGRASRLTGSTFPVALSVIIPFSDWRGPTGVEVILSCLKITHGCTHGEAEANDETTSQIAPQSPREEEQRHSPSGS